MSPQAIADPADLVQFAQELRHFNDQLQESMSRLTAGFGRVGDTWRDQEHQKYAIEFEQTMRVLLHFQQASEQQIPFLLRKAVRIRDYLDQR